MLALPDGRSYKFDLMALEGLRTEVGAPIRDFAIPGMHWLECILKARRRLAKAFQQPNLLQPFEPKAFQQPNLAQPSEPCDDSFLEELYKIMQPTSLAKEDFLAAHMLSLRKVVQMQGQLGTPLIGMAEHWCTLRRRAACAHTAMTACMTRARSEMSPLACC